jgi:protein-disulfide isomerase
MRAHWLALPSLVLMLACRPQPSASLELHHEHEAAEPSGLAEGATIIADAALPRTPAATSDPELDWTKVDDRLAALVLATGHERARVPYDAEHPTSGSAAPLVTVEVFYDYECPYSKKLVEMLGVELEARAGELRIVWRQFPLASHPQARLAAKAALAAEAQGGFEAMHAWLFANQRALSREAIEQAAAQLGLDRVRFAADLDSEWLERRVAGDTDLARHVHVSATPTYFINGRSFRGARDQQALAATLDEEQLLGRELVAAGSSPHEVWARVLAVANPDPPAPPKPAPTAPSAPNTTQRYAIDLAGAPRRGSKKAKVEILMCTDFDCPFCARSVATLEQLEKDNPKKIALAFRHFPLPMHTNARAAHRAAVAADRQGEFWAMWALLFANPKARSEAELEGFAKEIGLDVDRYEKDIADPDVDKLIDADIATCSALDVRGTPTFFLNGRALQGAQPVEKFQAIIDEELAGKGPPKAAAAPKAK